MPPAQTNLQAAAAKAVEDLRGQSVEQLAWLGAAPAGEAVHLRVLDELLQVDLGEGLVRTGRGDDVRPEWRILVLHYLAVRVQPAACPPEITFAHLPDGLVYARNYEGRVIRRLCATAGRDEASLRAAAAALNARPAAGGTVAFDLDVFPRVSVRLVWHAGDDELPPSASVLLPRNVESLLCVEDIVVLSEQLVSRLCGKPF